MVSPVAVRALVSDRLLGLVLAEAGLGIVGAAADATHGGERAGSLVVSVFLAPETAERLWGVRSKVEGAPAPEIDMGGKGTSDGDENLASRRLCSLSHTASGLFYNGLAGEKGERHVEGKPHHYTFGSGSLWVELEDADAGERILPVLVQGEIGWLVLWDEN